ncbi:hypothetical protein ACFQU2_03875 [Siccirubricoccus deserti]
MLLLMALRGWGQDYRTRPGLYSFPAEWEEEVREIVQFNGLRAVFVPSVCYHLELRSAGLIDDLNAALLKRAPTFGTTYPRITVG